LKSNGALNNDVVKAGRRPMARRDHEERFSALVNSTIEYAIYMLDTDGFVTSWNPGAERIKGYLQREVVGRHFAIFFTEEDQRAGQPAQALATAKQTGLYKGEGWRVRKGGARFWASVILEAMRDTDGHLIGFAKITRDETKRRLEEDAKDAHLRALSALRTELETAHDRLRMATDSAGIGIWDYDVQADVLLWDDWMYRLYGATHLAGTACSDMWRRYLHPEDRAAVEQAVADGISGVRPYDMSFRIVWDDGAVHHIRGTGYVTRDASGTPLRMIGCNWDITPLIQAKRARDDQRAQSKRWLELAEEIAHVGHWTLSVPGRELFLSDEIYRIAGMARGADVPKLSSTITIFHPADRDMIITNIERAIAEKSGYEWQARLYRPDGEVRHVLSRGVVQLDDAGTVTSIFGVFIDTTEQKEIEHQLETANRQAREANEALEIIAHVDSLTGLPNRRGFNRTFDVEFRRAIRERVPISLIMVDLDHFKAFNDSYGHPGGDECLRQVAAAIRGALLRPADVAARYGGEELAVVLPNTDLPGAAVVARAILEAVRALTIPHRHAPASIVTVSCGVAAIETPVATSEQAALIDRADRALYRAKQAGKNRLCLSLD
jgi:diguanylate cyclase (GGDEF)-like protein/PAS domain S-box-containing protein